MAFRGIRFVPDGTRIDFVKQRLAAFALSALFLLGTVVSLSTQGLNLGIDFAGGVLIELAAKEPIDIGRLRGQIERLRIGGADLQHFGAPNHVLIRIQAQGSDDASKAAVQKVRSTLGEEYEYRRVEQVGPKVGSELFRDGMIAAVLAVLAIAAYVYIRFEWQFALAALVATFHDVLIALGLFSVLGLEFDLTGVAALLTLAGYSINDTVVVFDRIREIVRKRKTRDLRTVVNLAVNQTLSRTIMTSGTTLLAVVPLLLFGGSTLFNFSLAVFWGILIGTYSSVFVAAALLLHMPPLFAAEPGEQRAAGAESAPL